MAAPEAQPPSDPDVQAAAQAERDQMDAAARDRAEAFRERAVDAGVYRDELVKCGFDDEEALKLVEHTLGWYLDSDPPWDS
jgi:hypothetical protein